MKKFNTWDEFTEDENHSFDKFNLGSLFENRKEKNKPNLQLLSVTIHNGVILKRNLEKVDDSSLDKTNYLYAKKDDLAYNTMRMWQGASGIVPEDGILSPAYTVLKLNENIDKNYAKFLFKNPLLIQKFHQFSQGLTDDTLNLKYNNLRSIVVRVPNVKIQKRIALILFSIDKLLNHLEVQLDKLIKLKEIVTNKLLHSNLENIYFKDNKLDIIPNGWEVKSIKNFFVETKNFTNTINKYPLYSLTIDEGITAKTDRYERSFLLTDLDKENYKVLEKDVFALNPMNLRFGAIAKNENDFSVCISKYYSTFKLKNSEFNSDFFLEYFKSRKMIKLYDMIATGTLDEKRRVHLIQFLNLKLPFPQKKTQDMIAKKLVFFKNKIKLKKLKIKKIKLLREGLIQDLITGKFKLNE